jgi:hypothetical protein
VRDDRLDYKPHEKMNLIRTIQQRSAGFIDLGVRLRLGPE